MSNIEDLNLNVEEESRAARNFAPLPAAEYNVIVSGSEMKDNKSGQGKHLGITLQVIDGDHEGRLLWHNFNVQNASPEAEKIGRAELASLCKAVGIINPKDSDELKNIPLVVRVGFDKNDATRNVVKAFMADKAKATSEPSEPAPAPAANPVSKSAPAKTAGKPWQKK